MRLRVTLAIAAVISITCFAAEPKHASGAHALPCWKTYSDLEMGSPERRILGRQIEAYQAAHRAEKEITSLEHQDDVLHATEDPVLIHKLGLGEAELASMRQGILDSDKGKLADYQRLMNPIAPENTDVLGDSNLLLNVLSGKDSNLGKQSRDALREVLDQGGHAGKWLLPPGLSNNEIRQAFSEAPVLNGYLHEMPGMLDAIKAYEAGAISRSAFQNRIRANLFHNGPEKGFWGFLGNVLVPGALDKASNAASTKRILEGTVFLNAAGKIQYPSVLSKLDAYHLILDRLSQGTGGGMIKIFHETSSFIDPIQSVREMVFKNPFGTMEQIDQAIVDIKNLPNTAPAAREALVEAAETAKARVKLYQEELAKRIKLIPDPSGEANKARLEMDGAIISPPETTDAKQAIFIAFQNIIADTEKRLKPMRVLSLGK